MFEGSLGLVRGHSSDQESDAVDSNMSEIRLSELPLNCVYDPLHIPLLTQSYYLVNLHLIHTCTHFFLEEMLSLVVATA